MLPKLDLWKELSSSHTVRAAMVSAQPTNLIEPSLRSVLPHEPPLTDEIPGREGYLHVQGALTRGKNTTDDVGSEMFNESSTFNFWSRERETLQRILLTQFHLLSYMSSVSPPTNLQLLDPHPPYTKLRLTFVNPVSAHNNLLLYRRLNLTALQLFTLQREDVRSDDILHDAISSEMRSMLVHDCLRNKPLHITEVTFRPLPLNSWTRSSPPKFRRLLTRPDEDSTLIDKERQSTRFVVLHNLLAINCGYADCWNNDSYAIAKAVRAVVAPYDHSRGMGVEVFVPSLAPKRSRYCYVGMRSASDAQALVQGLQGQVVQWLWKTHSHDNHSNEITTTMVSGQLFVDYVAITQRSEARALLHETGNEESEVRGEPTRPQCTSTTEHVVLPGLVLIPNFVTEEEEEVLLAALTGPQAPWAPAQKTASYESATVRRKVQHYGYVFDYRTADVLRDRSLEGADCPPMPAFPERGSKNLTDDRLLEIANEYARDGRGWELLALVIDRTRRYTFHNEDKEDSHISYNFPDLNQLTINHYLPGEGIGSHVDTPSAFDDGLISLSLNSGIVMEFRKVRGDVNKDTDTRKLVYLPPRSLLLMSRDARYNWEHTIVSRMTDTHNGEVLRRKLRLSLTLRTARSLDGTSHMPLVESTLFPPVLGTRSQFNRLVTPHCEREHVHAVYDAIATQWHHTRGKRGCLWPGATQFLQKLQPGSVVADVGCGDGKYFPAIWENGSYVLGTDISEPLLRTAIHDNALNEDTIPENRRVSAKRHHLRDRPAVVVADCMSVPFRTSSCDAAICIAVMHHLSTPERRQRCIEELVRIVKPGGLVNVQAWSIDQEEGSRRKFAANDVFVPFNAQPKYLQVDNMMANISQEKKDSDIATELMRKSTAQMYSEAFNAEYDDKKGLVIFQRYCHMYRHGELDGIALSVPGVQLLDSGFESGNYFIIFEVHKDSL